MDIRALQEITPGPMVDEARPSEKNKLFVLGLDLGQMQDYTALAIVERVEAEAHGGEGGARVEKHLHLRHLERYPLGTPYPQALERVGKIMATPALKGHCALVIDATGVGRAVVDMFKKAYLRPVAVTITAGNKVTSEGMEYLVPKRDLVGVVEVALQTGRFKMPRDLPEGKALMDEMLNFKRKVSLAGRDTYEAWREGTHDDLVLAVALAAWYAERHVRPRLIFI